MQYTTHQSPLFCSQSMILQNISVFTIHNISVTYKSCSRYTQQISVTLVLLTLTNISAILLSFTQHINLILCYSQYKKYKSLLQILCPLLHYISVTFILFTIHNIYQWLLSCGQYMAYQWRMPQHY
jgi:hypothetical protein